MKNFKTALKKMTKILLVTFVVVGFTTLTLTSCRHKKEQEAAPTPTPTPVPVLGNVVFVQGGHLVEFNLSNSQITPLTSGKSTEWFPAVSPKGDEVIYWSNVDATVYNLWKLNLITSQRTQLTFNDTDGLHPNEKNLLLNTAAAWSSDGKSVIYAQDGDIWAIDTDGYNARTILAGHSALCPNFSPDGKSVLYISSLNDSVYNLYVLTQSDKTIKKITNYTDWNVGSPSYSTDGTKILFNLYRGDVTQLYTAKVDGTDPINLTNNVRSLSPRFGQGDKKIYYAAYGAGDDNGLNIYVMSSNGTDIKELTTNGGASPSWGTTTVPITAAVTAAATPLPVSAKPAHK
jgi:Tol biopolymer transport system component